MKTPQSEHELKYESIAQQIGVVRLQAILTDGTYTVGFSKRTTYKAFPVPHIMADMLEQDEHLNNVSLARWDAQHDRVRGLLKGTGIKSWSLSDTVCVLKHVAKFHYAEHGKEVPNEN